jgi:ethanolamine ammonia-lyase large subunit
MGAWQNAAQTTLCPASTASARTWQFADLPLQRFLGEALIPYEADEVTRLIIAASMLDGLLYGAATR